jgi:L-amino acid N-acyltransferase YncA
VIDQPLARAPVKLRDCAEADMPGVTALYGHYVATSLATFEETSPSVAEMATRRAKVLTAGLPYLVAVNQHDHVLGFAYAAHFHTRSAYRFSVEDSIYVAAEATRHGIGGALLRALIERCTEAGMRQMVAVVGDSANAGSIALHARLGFRHVGVLADIGFKSDRWIDCVVMQRALGEGSSSAPR